MSDRLELLVNEDQADSPWLCGTENCQKSADQAFCDGPCIVTSGGTLQQEVRRDIVDGSTFGGQPALFSFDMWLIDVPDSGRTVTIQSVVDLGRQEERFPVTITRANVSQHVHHDLMIPQGYDTHGLTATVLVEASGGTVTTPYRLYLDNLSLVFYYPEGQLGPAPSTSLRGHERSEYTMELATRTSSTAVGSQTGEGQASNSGGGGSKLNIGAIIGGSLAGILLIGIVWIFLNSYMNKRKVKYQRELAEAGQAGYSAGTMAAMSKGGMGSPPVTAQTGYFPSNNLPPHLQPASPNTASAFLINPYPVAPASPQPSQGFAPSIADSSLNRHASMVSSHPSEQQLLQHPHSSWAPGPNTNLAIQELGPPSYEHARSEGPSSPTTADGYTLPPVAGPPPADRKR